MKCGWRCMICGMTKDFDAPDDAFKARDKHICGRRDTIKQTDIDSIKVNGVTYSRKTDSDSDYVLQQTKSDLSSESATDINSPHFKLGESQAPKRTPQDVGIAQEKLGDVSGCADILARNEQDAQDILDSYNQGRKVGKAEMLHAIEQDIDSFFEHMYEKEPWECCCFICQHQKNVEDMVAEFKKEKLARYKEALG